MLLLDPVNSITSVSFYKKVANQKASRTALYLVYLGVLFSLAITVAAKMRLGPALEETFAWLEQSMPTLTYANGKITSALTAPLTLRHPRYAEIAMTIDTTRIDPVTPQMMDDQKVIGYLTTDKLYFMEQPGRIQIYDLAKAANGLDKPVSVDAAFYRRVEDTLSRALYPFVLVFTFLAFLIWKSAAALFYSLPALIANSSLNAALPYSTLYTIALYAQTLLTVLQIMLAFKPIDIPYFPILGFAATTIYIWLAVKAAANTAAAA